MAGKERGTKSNNTDVASQEAKARSRPKEETVGDFVDRWMRDSARCRDILLEMFEPQVCSELIEQIEKWTEEDKKCRIALSYVHVFAVDGSTIMGRLENSRGVLMFHGESLPYASFCQHVQKVYGRTAEYAALAAFESAARVYFEFLDHHYDLLGAIARLATRDGHVSLAEKALSYHEQASDLLDRLFVRLMDLEDILRRTRYSLMDSGYKAPRLTQEVEHLTRMGEGLVDQLNSASDELEKQQQISRELREREIRRRLREKKD
jgi:hypothetical protein